MLLEQDYELGGGTLLGGSVSAWRKDTLATLAAAPEVRILTRTTAIGAYDHGVFAAVERSKRWLA